MSTRACFSHRGPHACIEISLDPSCTCQHVCVYGNSCHNTVHNTIRRHCLAQALHIRSWLGSVTPTTTSCTHSGASHKYTSGLIISLQLCMPQSLQADHNRRPPKKRLPSTRECNTCNHRPRARSCSRMCTRSQKTLTGLATWSMSTQRCLSLTCALSKTRAESSLLKGMVSSWRSFMSLPTSTGTTATT